MEYEVKVLSGETIEEYMKRWANRHNTNESIIVPETQEELGKEDAGSVSKQDTNIANSWIKLRLLMLWKQVEAKGRLTFASWKPIFQLLMVLISYSQGK